MRLVEIALFLVPFALFAGWRVLAPSERIPRIVAVSFVGAVLLMLVVLLVLHQMEAADAGRPYVPARMEDGRVIPGHAAVP